MKARLLAALPAIVVAITPFTALAQSTTKPARVGILLDDSAAPTPLWNECLERLRLLGWERGRNLIVETRYTESRPELFASAAAELVALSPDVIVAPNSQAVEAAMTQTASVPIVMLNVADPVGAGFIKSLANPGSNVTGSTNQLKDVIAKHHQLLLEIRPGLERLGQIFTPSNAGSALGLQENIVAMRELGVALVPIPLDQPSDLEAASAILARERPQALLVHVTPIAVRNLAEIAKLAVAHRLPSVAAYKVMAQGGLLMSYGPDRVESWRRAAIYIDKLLRGESPSNLPVEQPTKFELVINIKTATALGLTIPPTLLARADEVIE